MKKIFLTLVILIVLLSSTGCGNKQIFDFNYTFNKAYVKIGEEWFDLELKSWKDYDGEQLQLILKDGTVILTNSMNCIIYNGTLPSQN